MKKLFLSSHGLSSVGIDIFVANIAKSFDREKWDVSLVLALDEGGEKQPREDEVRNAGIPILYTCDLGSIKRILTHLLRLYRILRDGKVDVYHSNMGVMDGLNCLMALFAGVPVRVTHSHTTDSHYAAKTGRTFVARLVRAAMRLLCAVVANRRCGCSEQAMVYMYGEKWQKDPRNKIINNGIDLRRFRSGGTGKHSGPRRIVSVGRLVNEKNPMFALEVMDELRKLRTDFVYEWVGGGALKAQVEEAIREKGLQDHVKLLGVRNDIEDILPQCSLFLMPSLFEGFSIALIEAQATGLPCVTSDRIPSNANFGGCRFLSLEESPARWAEEISCILDGNHNLRTEPEKLRKYDVSYTIEQLEQVYSR